MDFLIILAIGFGFMWLLIVLPQRRRASAHEKLVAGLRTGDEIMTAGGVYGRVTAIGDEALDVEIAPGVEVRVARRAIAAVVGDRPAADAEGDAGSRSAEEIRR